MTDYVVDKEENREKGNPAEIKHTLIKGKPLKGKIIKIPLLEVTDLMKGNITSEFDALSEHLNDRGDIDMKGMATKGRKKFPNDW